MESVAYRAVVRAVKLLNLALMTGSAVLCWLLCYAGPGAGSMTTLLVSVVFFSLYMTYGRTTIWPIP